MQQGIAPTCHFQLKSALRVQTQMTAEKRAWAGTMNPRGTIASPSPTVSAIKTGTISTPMKPACCHAEESWRLPAACQAFKGLARPMNLAGLIAVASKSASPSCMEAAVATRTTSSLERPAKRCVPSRRPTTARCVNLEARWSPASARVTLWSWGVWLSWQRSRSQATRWWQWRRSWRMRRWVWGSSAKNPWRWLFWTWTGTAPAPISLQPTGSSSSWATFTTGWPSCSPTAL